MTFIQLSAPSVRNYESQAEEQFGEIIATMSTMVGECNAVDYEGMNAASFKKGVVTAVETMSTDINTGMTQFIGAIAAATTSVAQSLGGSPLILEPVKKTVDQVAVSEGSADEQQLDTETFNALQETINGHTTKIRGLVDAHSLALSNTVWQGNSKEAAVRACTSFTSTVSDAITAAHDKIKLYIGQQTDAALTADNQA